MRRLAPRIVLALVFGSVLGPLVPLPAGAIPPPPTRFLAAPVAGSGESFTTGVVEAPGGFDVAGLAYDGPAHVEVDVRASTDGRRFTPWFHAGEADEEGPDPGSRERPAARSTLPVWTGAARYVQYRVQSEAGPVRRLRLQAVDAQGHHESTLHRLGRRLRGLISAPPRPAHALTDQPAVVSRSQWGADESIRREPPSYGDVQIAIVHHTVTGNGYSPEQAPALIRGIYAFHVKGNGWNDIGYNFLVDRYGTVYEGRYGGIDRNVIGAHAEGFNASSFGVSMLGTFDRETPTPAMLDAAERLIAWRLDLAHVDPLGQATVTSRGSNKWPAGTRVLLNDIIGHRDVGQTDCPGQLAYNQLAAIRSAVADIGRPKLFAPGASGTVHGIQANGYAPATITAGASDDLSWSLTVSHFALGTVKHLTASGQQLSAPWDGTDDAGKPVPGGEYTVQVDGSGAAGPARPGTTAVTVDNSNEPKPVTRLAGADRFATAGAVSREVSPSRADDVVLASGTTAHLVDSLVAAPLAKAKTAPLLLTDVGLPPATAAELDRLQPRDAWVVGGTAAVPQEVADAVTARGIAVHRLAGDDAPGTAAAVARAMGPLRPGAVVVARESDHLVDGLASSGPAAGLGRPVLLVTHDSVPPVTSSTLGDLHSLDVWAVGGVAAISDDVVNQLHAQRVAGPDRYATAAAMAERAAGAGLPSDAYVLASGENGHLVDALSGGALAVAVLLTPHDALPKVTWDVVYGHRSAATRAWALGGTSAIVSSPPADLKHAINAS